MSKNSANTNKNLLASFGKLLLMEEFLHQLIVSLSHYLQGFISPRWCRISSIISIMASTWKNLKIDRFNFPLKNTCFAFGWEEVSRQEGHFIAAAASTNTKIKKVRSHALNNWTRHHVWSSFGKHASFHQKPIKMSLQRSLILWHTRSSIESSRRVKGSRPGVTFLLVDDVRTFFIKWPYREHTWISCDATGTRYFFVFLISINFRLLFWAPTKILEKMFWLSRVEIMIFTLKTSVGGIPNSKEVCICKVYKYTN